MILLNNVHLTSESGSTFRDLCLVLLTLSQSERPEHGQLEVGALLGAVDDGPVRPQRQPVVVGERRPLLEGVHEDDGHDQGHADGLEVLHVHVQPHLETQRSSLRQRTVAGWDAYRIFVFCILIYFHYFISREFCHFVNFLNNNNH